MHAFGICSTEVARQQMRCFQSHLSALLGGDRLTVQIRLTLKLGDVANSMGKSFEGPKPIAEIEGRAPLLIKRSKQHPHRAAENHGRLADEAVGTKTIKPNRWQQGWIALNKARLVVELLALPVHHQLFGMGVESSKSPGEGPLRDQIRKKACMCKDRYRNIFLATSKMLRLASTKRPMQRPRKHQQLTGQI